MLPELYHAHHSLEAEDLPFWLRLASESEGPILELGCGTGRVALRLAQAGHTVFGLDRDHAMLAFFREHTPDTEKDRVKVFQADFRCYRLAQRFTLVLLPCNTYSTLDAEARRAVLECAHKHLAPGGRLAVSMPNPVLLKRLPGRSEAELEVIFPHPVDGQPVQVSSGWRRHGQQLLVTWHYDHLQPNGEVRRSTVEVAQNLEDCQTYLNEMQQAGFETLQAFGDYDFSGYSHRSPNLILLASTSQPG